MQADIKDLVNKGLNAAAQAAPATERAYKSDLRQFEKWCLDRELKYFPTTADVLIAYLVDRVAHGRSISTLTRFLSACSRLHKRDSITNPALDTAVKATLRGLSRSRSTATKRAKPIALAQLARIVSRSSPAIPAKRDAALLAIAWCGALRSAELVGLTLEDIEHQSSGIIVTLRRSKTDQLGAGRRIAIPFAGPQFDFCPVCALQSWLILSKNKNDRPETPLFFRLKKSADKDFFCFIDKKEALSTRSISPIVRRALKNAGYDTTGYSSHSLRAGFITAAAAANCPEWSIQRHTGHHSERILRQYIRLGTLFTANPLTALLQADRAENKDSNLVNGKKPAQLPA